MEHSKHEPQNNETDLSVNSLILMLNHIKGNGTETVRIKKQVHGVLKEYCKKEKINMSKFTTSAILEKLIKEV